MVSSHYKGKKRFLTPFLSQNEARRELIRLCVDIEYEPFRARAIVGDWHRKVTQNPGKLYPDGCNYPISVKQAFSRRTIEGGFEIELPYEGDTLHLDFSVKGGFEYERFVQLNYSLRDRRAIQFGSVIAELSDDGHAMNGKFVGYGAQSEEIVTGTVELAKKSD